MNLQNNQTKILGGIVIVLIIGFAIFASKNKTPSTGEVVSQQNNVASSTTSNTVTNTNKPKITSTTLSGKCNLKITYPLSGSRVSFPLTIKGTIDETNPQKGGCTWYETGTLAGSAQLFYNFNNYGWKSPGIAVPLNINTSIASTSAFSTTLNFYNQGVGLPSGSPIKITFVEFNPLNTPNPDTFDFYVSLK